MWKEDSEIILSQRDIILSKRLLPYTLFYHVSHRLISPINEVLLLNLLGTIIRKSNSKFKEYCYSTWTDQRQEVDLTMVFNWGPVECHTKYTSVKERSKIFNKREHNKRGSKKSVACLLYVTRGPFRFRKTDLDLETADLNFCGSTGFGGNILLDLISILHIYLKHQTLVRRVSSVQQKFAWCNLWAIKRFHWNITHIFYPIYFICNETCFMAREYTDTHNIRN